MTSQIRLWHPRAGCDITDTSMTSPAGCPLPQPPRPLSPPPDKSNLLIVRSGVPHPPGSPPAPRRRSLQQMMFHKIDPQSLTRVQGQGHCGGGPGDRNPLVMSPCPPGREPGPGLLHPDLQRRQTGAGRAGRSPAHAGGAQGHGQQPPKLPGGEGGGTATSRLSPRGPQGPP